MSQLKWRIKDNKGHYVITPMDKEGTILITNDITMATVFNQRTRDYMDGFCAGLNAVLDGKFTPVPYIHVEVPTKVNS